MFLLKNIILFAYLMDPGAGNNRTVPGNRFRFIKVLGFNDRMTGDKVFGERQKNGDESRGT
jgi:hypothetical protein